MKIPQSAPHRFRRAIRVISLTVLAGISCVHTAAGQLRVIDDYAVLIEAAPAFLFPDAKREPLRVLPQGTIVRVLDAGPEWFQVEFIDPQWGERIGQIQAKFLRPIPKSEARKPIPGVPAITVPARVTPPPPANVAHVRSKDGTLIAVECAGAGPTLVIVHGGVGDRTRWTPMLPLLSSRLTACAMDRRGHGESGDSPPYSLQKEAEDVAAVVESLPGDVFVLGDSSGGVAALEAAFLTRRIRKLILYEPPVEGPIGEDRATDAFRFDAARMKRVTMPTLLLIGEDTTNPYLKKGTASLQAALPDSTVTVLQGQQHNAMDGARELLAQRILDFLFAK